MDFLIGAISSFIFVLIIIKVSRQADIQYKPMSIRHTQSHFHKLMSPFYPVMQSSKDSMRPKKHTQSTRFNEDNTQRLIIIDNEAYWIKDSVFMKAPMVDGAVDMESTKSVDIMAMDKVELDKMIFIVDKLTRGFSNDDRSSGKS